MPQRPSPELAARDRAAPEVVFGLAVLLAVALTTTDCTGESGTARPPEPGLTWVVTWTAAPQRTEERNLPPSPGFEDTTLRQIAHVSLGASTLRLRFSNAFGDAPLTLHSPHVALSRGASAIETATDSAVTFQGRTTVTIPTGALALSDPIDLDVPPLSDLAVTVHVEGAPSAVTGHPGSRTTSYLQPGRAVSAPALPEAGGVDHWYFLRGIEVLAPHPAAAIAVLGDSITDGRGSTTNGNDRWPDQLARRLSAWEPTEHVAVANLGIGGNRLLRDGLGPSALARLDRDVLAQPGVRWLIVFEGVNDLGTRADLDEGSGAASVADDVIVAYRQIVARAHAHGIRVIGVTLLPFGGHSSYDSPAAAADRRTVNEWIRTAGHFDAVLDFDAVARDPASPERLSPAVDGGDHLHPSAAGYAILADSVDLGLFVEPER